MTVYEAVNPLHKRTVDTDDLWWMKDAWNERTKEWFSADKAQMALLVRSLNNLLPLGVPEFLPSPEWLADALIKAFPSELAPYDTATDVLTVAYAVETAAPTAGYLQSATLGVASKLLFSMVPLSEKDVELLAKPSSRPDQYLIGYEKSVAGDYKPNLESRFAFGDEAPSLLGIAANPSLPRLETPAHPGATLNTYRWLFKTAIRSQAKHRDALVSILASNHGASTGDLEFFLQVLDEEGKKWKKRNERAEYKTSMSRFYGFDGSISQFEIEKLYGLIRVHPNFVSWPSVETLYKDKSKTLSLPRTSSVITFGDPTQHSVSVRDRYLLNRKYPATAVDGCAQNYVSTALLEDPKGGLLRKLANRLRKAIQGGEGAAEQYSYLSFHAPLLGAVFANLDKKYESENVPLEWTVGLL